MSARGLTLKVKRFNLESKIDQEQTFIATLRETSERMTRALTQDQRRDVPEMGYREQSETIRAVVTIKGQIADADHRIEKWLQDLYEVRELLAHIEKSA